MNHNEKDNYSQLLKIDQNIEKLYQEEDKNFLYSIEASKKANLPEIHVSSNEGRLLYLLSKMRAPKKILEIGTLGAYSTLWLAKSLSENGKLITLEFNPNNAKVATEVIEKAQLSKKVEVRVGAALDLLPLIEQQNIGPFDVIFIDADKNNYMNYLDWAVKLSCSGTLLLIDNVIRRDSALLGQVPDDATTIMMDKLNKRLATDPALESVIFPILRERVDGLAVSLVR